MIAAEVAQFLYETNRRSAELTEFLGAYISNLTWLHFERRWAEALEDSADDIKEDIRHLFEAIRGRLTALTRDKAEDLFDDLSEAQKKNHGLANARTQFGY